MNLGTLKKWRSLVPGFLALAVLSPLATLYPPLLAWASTAVALVGSSALVLGAAAAVGSLYNAFDVRDIVFSRSTQITDDNIITRILSMRPESREMHVPSNKAILNAFYRIIDNDRTLTERANLVRENGLYWSSSADAIIICLFGSTTLGITYLLFTPTPVLQWAVYIETACALVSLIIHEALGRRHLNLSNDQLDYIEQYHKKEIELALGESL